MSSSSLELERLARRVPVARGRALKEAFQRTMAEVDQTSRLIETKADQRLTPKETTKIHRDLADHQRRLVRDVSALLLHGMAVDADVAVVAGHLRRTQYVAAHAEDLAVRAHGAVEELSECLAGLAEFVGDLRTRMDRRFDAVELAIAELSARLRRVEAASAAERSFRRIVTSWQNGTTYAELPWPGQAVLLAQEVFAGPVGHYELVTGDHRRYRAELAELVLGQADHGSWPVRTPVADVVRDVADGLGSGPAGLRFAEWLGAGLSVELDGIRGPLILALRNRILSSDGDAVPPAAARLGAGVPLRLDTRGFVRQVVNEQAETQLGLRRAAWPLELGPIAPEETGDGP